MENKFNFNYVNHPADMNIAAMKARVRFMQNFEKEKIAKGNSKIKNIYEKVIQKNRNGRLKVAHSLHGFMQKEPGSDSERFNIFRLQLPSSQKISELYNEEMKRSKQIKKLEKSFRDNFYDQHKISFNLKKSLSQPKLGEININFSGGNEDTFYKPKDIKLSEHNEVNLKYQKRAKLAKIKILKNQKKNTKDNKGNEEEEKFFYNKFKGNPSLYESLSKTFYRFTSHAMINVSSFFPRNRMECNAKICENKQYGLNFDMMKNIWVNTQKKKPAN